MNAYDFLLPHRTCPIYAGILLGSCVALSCFGQAMIDVRNPLPGIVDAPVHLADGVTRVDNEFFASAYSSQVVAQLFVGEDESSLFPVG